MYFLAFSFLLEKSQTVEFKEMIKQDVEIALGQELENLKKTLPIDLQIAAEDVKRTNDEFTGFQKLFAKFLSSDTQLGIDWNHIEKLPADSVSNYVQTF